MLIKRIIIICTVQQLQQQQRRLLTSHLHAAMTAATHSRPAQQLCAVDIGDNHIVKQPSPLLFLPSFPFVPPLNPFTIQLRDLGDCCRVSQPQTNVSLCKWQKVHTFGFKM